MSCCRVNKLSGSQWHDYLVSAFKECKEKDDPMVVIFHNFVSGEDPMYMEAFEKFIDFAVSENATFVSTNELVELTRKQRNHLT